MKTIRTIFTLLIFFTFTACIDDAYDIDNLNTEMMLDDYSLVLPIGKVDVNIEELLTNFKIENLYVEGNTFYIGYKDTLDVSAMDFVSINADGVQPKYQFPVATGTEFKLNEKFRLNVSSDQSTTRVDSIRLKKSKLKLVINSALSSSAELTLAFPKSSIQTTPTSPVFTVNPGRNDLSLTINDKSVVALSSDLLGSYFETQFTLKTANSTVLKPGDVTMDFSFESFDFDVIWGLFPDIDGLSAKGDFKLDLFQEFLPEGTQVAFTDPTIICDIYNYNGIGLALNLDYLKAYKKDGTETTLDFNGSPSTTIPVNPSLIPEKPVLSSVIFDNNYGKIGNLLDTNIEKIAFSFTTGTKTDNTENQFLFKEKSFDIALDLKVPLSFEKGSVLLTKDTLKVGISSLPSEVKLEDLVLRLDYASALPINAKLGVEFLDSNKVTIATIKPKSYTLNSATVDNNGIAVSETKGMIHVKFDNTEISAVPKADYLALKIEVSGATPESRITFSKKDYLSIKADFFVKGDFILNKK